MIYLDNSATTPMCGEAISAVEKTFEIFGNPSSLHDLGIASERMKEQARSSVMKALNANPLDYSLVFTSGGTEANNLAILGCAKAKNFKNPKIIISESEHPCIREPAAFLESIGWRVVRIKANGGVIDYDEAIAQVDQDTVLMSVMAVNNETGARYDVGKLFVEAKKKNPSILTHTDAVQAFLKIPFAPKNLHADMVTVSSHKIYGPKGSGALLIKNEIIRSKRISPVIYGGGQENALRSGTENVPGIVGFGAAAEAGYAGFKGNYDSMSGLRDYLISVLPTDVKVNNPPACAPHIISITLPGIKSETMLHYLSDRNIYVSSGSACSSHGKHGSYVLADYGLSQFESDCTIRVSLSHNNTRNDADQLAIALSEGINSLIKIRR